VLGRCWATNRPSHNKRRATSNFRRIVYARPGRSAGRCSGRWSIAFLGFAWVTVQEPRRAVPPGPWSASASARRPPPRSSASIRGPSVAGRRASTGHRWGTKQTLLAVAREQRGQPIACDAP